MKNILQRTVTFALLSATVLTGFSQQNNFCDADVMRKQLLKDHPEILLTEKASDEFALRFTQEDGARSGPIIIPLVFHIIHQGGSENITDAQVRDQVRILNEDYNKRNADTAQVIPQFQSIIANVGIEFRLATKDPDGNCTNGIEHIYGSQTYGGNDYCKLHPWPHDKYLNVWVFKKMRDGVAGYAYLPASVGSVAELPMIDGINILNNYVGSIGTSSPFNSSALTHEIGHFLNLRHCWGNTNEPGVMCDDDGVFDTPRTKGWQYCPQPTAAAVCDPNIVENYQNFMEYSYCDNMFTEGQKTRMLATLNDTVAERNRLWSNTSLMAAGVDQNQPSQCSPICDFTTNKMFACVGDQVTFIDQSSNADIIGRNWTFQGANITNSIDSMVTVSFPYLGNYPVTLDVASNWGTGSKTSNEFKVMDTANVPTPYYTGFDNAFDFDYNWAVINGSRDIPRFHQAGTVGRNSSSSSVLLDCYNNRSDYNFDDLISPAFNCTNLNATTGWLSFWYSYATWNSGFTIDPTFNMTDSITVYITRNCGATWQKIYADGSNTLFNSGYSQGYFVPGSHPTQWKNVKVAIPTTYRTRGVRFRIQLSSSNKANNFYLDDFQVGLNAVGIEEQEEMLADVNVMPNPFSSQLRIENLNPGEVSYELHDITGRRLISVTTDNQNETLSIDLSDVTSSGVYLLTLKQGNASKTFRVVKQ